MNWGISKFQGTYFIFFKSSGIIFEKSEIIFIGFVHRIGHQSALVNFRNWHNVPAALPGYQVFIYTISNTFKLRYIYKIFNFIVTNTIIADSFSKFFIIPLIFLSIFFSLSKLIFNSTVYNKSSRFYLRFHFRFLIRILRGIRLNQGLLHVVNVVM